MKSLGDMQREAQQSAGAGGTWECPRCGCRDWGVRKTWTNMAGEIRRSRVCRNCGHGAIKTTERPDVY